MRYGKSFNHLTASSSIFNSESASDNKVFAIQALLPEVSDNKKLFVEKNEGATSLKKLTVTNLLLRKLTLASLFLIKHSTALVQTLSI